MPTAPKPGIIPLRPLRIGELYDGAFQAIRTNPSTMIGTSALVLAAIVAISVGPQATLLRRLGGLTALQPNASTGLTPGQLAGLAGDALGSVALPAFLQFIALTVLNALLVVAVSRAVIGRRMSAGLLWRRVRRRVPAVLGQALVTIVTVITVVVGSVTPGLLLLANGQSGAGIGLLLLGVAAGLAVALVIGIRWSLSGPALLLEELGVFAALARSWRLSRASFWRLLGILLLTEVIVVIGRGIISVPFGVAGSLVQLGSSTPYTDQGRTLAQLLIEGVGTIITGAVFYPFSAAVTALLYVDLRMRREGLDVELIRAAGDVGPG